MTIFLLILIFLNPALLLYYFFGLIHFAHFFLGAASIKTKVAAKSNVLHPATNRFAWIRIWTDTLPRCLRTRTTRIQNRLARSAHSGFFVAQSVQFYHYRHRSGFRIDERSGGERKKCEISGHQPPTDRSITKQSRLNVSNYRYLQIQKRLLTIAYSPVPLIFSENFLNFAKIVQT